MSRRYREPSEMGESEDERMEGLIKSDSTDSRWVYQDTDESDHAETEGERSPTRPELDSEEEDNVEQRLVRTGHRVDSLDVEAAEIPGTHRYDFEEFGRWRHLIVVLQTLGAVFGVVGTSPLYAFSVMFTRAPINGEEDVLGALSLVIYTLILFPLVKYIFIVLWANDDGEGGTFALYSLICRHAKASLIPNHLEYDTHMSSFRLKVPSRELERSLKIKECLEKSLAMKKLLLILVLAGTSMVLVDSIVTPAISVLSAVGGLEVGISGTTQEVVVMISVALFVVLFTLQKYVTSKMGLVVGPLLLIWFLSLACFGIYNIAKYDAKIWRAFNPLYIYHFFTRNSDKAFYALGGCLLTATGSEVMFADLGFFPVRSIQLTFVLLVFPCLLLGYLGQAAYLIQNPTDYSQAFYKSIPSGAFWPMFVIANFAALIASRAMTMATFSCIKQSTALGCFPRLKIIHTSRKFLGQMYIPAMNWFLLVACVVLVCAVSSITELGNAYGLAEIGVMITTTITVTLVMLIIWQINIIPIMAFLVCFLAVELIFFSSVVWNMTDGSWIILVYALFVFFMMYIWNYGSKLKYDVEVREKMSMDVLRDLGSNLGTVRAPGIGLVYNELVKGIPAIFGQFLTTLPAMHSMIIFVCIKYVPVPTVTQNERFLFRRICPRSYHMFRCIARYGYKDVRKENHQTFEQLLIECLEKFIRREAQERSLESDGDADMDSEDESFSPRVVVHPNGDLKSLRVPLLSEEHNGSSPSSSSISEASTSRDARSRSPADIFDAQQSLERELSFIRKAKESGVVYLLGHGNIRATKDSWFIKKLAVNYFYAFLRKNSRRGISNLSVPHSHLMQVAMTYMV